MHMKNKILESHSTELFDALDAIMQIVYDSEGVKAYKENWLDDFQSWDDFPEIEQAHCLLENIKQELS